MIFTRTLDASLAIAVALAMLVLVIIKGDALYLGLWYYIAVPVVVLGTCAAFRPLRYSCSAPRSPSLSQCSRLCLLTGALPAPRVCWAWAISSRCLAHLSLCWEPLSSQEKNRWFAHSRPSFLGLVGAVAAISSTNW